MATIQKKDIVLYYEDVVKYIEDEIRIIWTDLSSSKEESIKKIMDSVKNIEISDEQMFIKDENKQLDQKTLYITVKFGQGPINFGSTVAPIYLTCLGTANKVKPAQLLLGVFASTWTTKNLRQGLVNPGNNNESLEITNAAQVWNTPEVISNFNTYRADFRNLFRLSGNIILGPSAVRMGTMTYIYDEEHYDAEDPNTFEVVNIMSFHEGYQASLDSQPFGNSYGFAKSEVNFSTDTFTISTYLLNNYTSATALSVMGYRNRTSTGIGAMFNSNDEQKTPARYDDSTHYFSVHKNDYVKIKLTFTNGYTNMPNSSTEVTNENDDVSGEQDFFCHYKIVSAQLQQEIASIPMIALTFTR